MADTAAPLSLRRAGPAGPRTLDREARTVEVVAATAAPVKRSAPNPAGEWESWTEVLDIAKADTARFIGGPVLLDHRNETGALVGSVQSARVVGGELVATVRIAGNERGSEALSLIEDRHLTGVSIGYRITGWKRDGDTFVATIEILEISLTPIPADPNARIRSAGPETRAPQEAEMAKDTTTAPSEGAEAAIRAERARIASFEAPVTRAREAGLADPVLNCLRQQAIEGGWTADQLQSRMFEALAKGRAADAENAKQEPAGIPAVRTAQYLGSHDDPSARIERMAGALAARVLGKKPEDDQRDYMHAGFSDMAAELMEARGLRVSRREAPANIIQRSFLTTSDFPLLLQETGARIMADRLAAAESPWDAVCRRVTVPDFRPGNFIEAAGVLDLAELNEAAEIELAPPAERGEGFKAKTFARGLRFTRQALVNDDLGAFDQFGLFANAVINSVGTEFVKLFAPNSTGWGPTLRDGVPLWHEDHDNTAPGFPTTGGISAGRKVARGQKDAAGNLVSWSPSIVMVGPSMETAIEQALSLLAVALAEDDRPVFAGRLRHVVEPRLPGNEWFLFADPGQHAMLAYITVGSSNGIPMISSHELPNFDGIALKCVHDFAFAPMGFTGGVRMDGVDD